MLCLFLRHKFVARRILVAAVRQSMQISWRRLRSRFEQVLCRGHFFASKLACIGKRKAFFMKRALLPLIAVVALGALSCTASAQDGPVMKRIAETKTVTIGHRDASVPLSYLGPDGKVQGYSIDICLKIVDAAKEELKLDKIDVKFVPLTPQTRIPLLTAGTVDIICESSTHTIGRSRQISFLNTTFLTGSKLLVRKTSGIKKIEDMTDKVLVAVLGTTNEKAAQAEIDAKKIKIKGEIVKVKDHSQAMLNLEQGRADAYVSDDVVLYGLKSASKNPDEWEIVGPYFSYDPYGMMIPRNNDDFRLLGNKTIAKLIQSGDMAAIYKKWFEPGPTNINYPMSDRLKENFQLIALPD
jgi:glutamate/aspartate transport system substrate-binding protein